MVSDHESLPLLCDDIFTQKDEGPQDKGTTYNLLKWVFPGDDEENDIQGIAVEGDDANKSSGGRSAG